MKILSLDQSLSITAWSVFDTGELITYGIVKTGNSKKHTQEERIEMIVNKIIELIDKYDIEQVILEDIQSQKNVKTYRILSMLLGILTYKLYEMKIPFEIISPSSWRSTLCIKGRKRVEQKANAKLFVKNKYDIDVTEDEADSICIGLSYIKKKRKVFK